MNYCVWLQKFLLPSDMFNFLKLFFKSLQKHFNEIRLNIKKDRKYIKESSYHRSKLNSFGGTHDLNIECKATICPYKWYKICIDLQKLNFTLFGRVFNGKPDSKRRV